LIEKLLEFSVRKERMYRNKRDEMKVTQREKEQLKMAYREKFERPYHEVTIRQCVDIRNLYQVARVEHKEHYVKSDDSRFLLKSSHLYFMTLHYTDEGRDMTTRIYNRVEMPRFKEKMTWKETIEYVIARAATDVTGFAKKRGFKVEPDSNVCFQRSTVKIHSDNDKMLLKDLVENKGRHVAILYNKEQGEAPSTNALWTFQFHTKSADTSILGEELCIKWILGDDIIDCITGVCKNQHRFDTAKLRFDMRKKKREDRNKACDLRLRLNASHHSSRDSLWTTSSDASGSMSRQNALLSGQVIGDVEQGHNPQTEENADQHRENNVKRRKLDLTPDCGPDNGYIVQVGQGRCHLQQNYEQLDPRHYPDQLPRIKQYQPEKDGTPTGYVPVAFSTDMAVTVINHLNAERMRQELGGSRTDFVTNELVQTMADIIKRANRPLPPKRVRKESVEVIDIAEGQEQNTDYEELMKSSDFETANNDDDNISMHANENEVAQLTDLEPKDMYSDPEQYKKGQANRATRKETLRKTIAEQNAVMVENDNKKKRRRD
jgi:hypothetical protein